MPVFPLTGVRVNRGPAGGEAPEARGLWDAAAVTERARAWRSTTYPLAVRRTPADGVGHLVGEAVAVLARASPGEWEHWSEGARGYSLTHGFLRSEVYIRVGQAAVNEPGARPPRVTQEVASTLAAAAGLGAATGAPQRLDAGDSGAAALVTWDGALQPGEFILLGIAAGGALTIGGPGEVVEARLTQPVWVRVLHPRSAAITAGREGVSPDLAIGAEMATDIWGVRGRQCAQPPSRRTGGGGAAVADRGSGNSTAGSHPALPLGSEFDRWLRAALEGVEPMGAPPPRVCDGVRLVLGAVSPMVLEGACAGKVGSRGR